MKTIKSLSKAITLVGLSASLMANQSCKDAQANNGRQLKRRVQIVDFSAPDIYLPGDYATQKFDFSTVAKAQLVDVFNKTKSFSTANMSNTDYSTGGLSQEISDDFNKCEDLMAQSFESSGVVSQKVGDITPVNSCVINLPQALITGSINDFALVNSAGLSVGIANIPALTGLTFSFKSYNLQVEMSARRPLDIGKNAFVSSLKNQKGYSGGLSATMNFGGLSLGPSFYHTSPLAKVVYNGLTSAVSDLATQWNTDDPWYANVLKSCDSYMYINGGNDLGLKVGDIVAIKNVRWAWEGLSCKSTAMGSGPDATPVAYARIDSVGDVLSSAVIIKGDENYPHANSSIYAGARVYMYQTIEQINAAKKTK